MVVLNEMSRFHLVLDALKHIPRLRVQAAVKGGAKPDHWGGAKVSQ
jgi:phosphoketolase